MARAYLARHALSDAEPLLRHALAVREQKLRAGDWRIAQARALLGAVLLERHQLGAAEPLLRAAARDLKDVPGPQGADARATAERLRVFDVIARR
jgi:hypothetical protein